LNYIGLHKGQFTNLTCYLQYGTQNRWLSVKSQRRSEISKLTFMTHHFVAIKYL